MSCNSQEQIKQHVKPKESKVEDKFMHDSKLSKVKTTNIFKKQTEYTEK